MERRKDATVYNAVIYTDKEYSSDRLNAIMAENEFILSVERCDNE